ncbi:unnamed protein product [Allacma fusca]|uniref:Peptidase S1 domain-containing protein n=1 Tax=Allacma fusca TaxID=39272 RepID=A0A8J2PJX1_9HEXA|nr:unnamed protein product [Allacma fusca]
MYKRSWFLGRPSYDCSAALIDENWILTAAHCFEKVQTYLYLVSLGDNNLQSPQSKNFRRISKIVTHPEYNKLIEYDNDIALMKLERSVEYSESVRFNIIMFTDTNFCR